MLTLVLRAELFPETDSVRHSKAAKHVLVYTVAEGFFLAAMSDPRLSSALVSTNADP